MKEGEWSNEEKRQLTLIVKTVQAYKDILIDISEVLKRLEEGNISIMDNSKVIGDIERGKKWVVAEALLKRSQVKCKYLWTAKLDDSKTRGSF